ncbi:DUF2935 domain-containing protein [Metabacillus arenae]|uniref:DUF2935 domain-containing protein n=1 Tax=Metabacillus arenae TaxID=2771434 RepID=UPI0029655EA8|nr:DUF2935 domain-containing protein [Metabacillus arenae]
MKFELQFWTQILGDHSTFIHDSLAPSKKVYIDNSSRFRKNLRLLSSIKGRGVRPGAYTAFLRGV